MMMIGKGTLKKKIAMKAMAASADHDPVAQRALADADHGLDHDRQHRGLQPEEQRLDEPDLAERGIDIAQAHDGDDAGENEQAAGHDAAGGTMQQPADIGRELLRLRSRQQHAVVQCVQEPAFGNPVFFLDQDAMHHRDLSGRTAETQDGDPQPDPKGLTEADAVAGRSFGALLACHDSAHGFALLVGQLWVSPDASRHQR